VEVCNGHGAHRPRLNGTLLLRLILGQRFKVLDSDVLLVGHDSGEFVTEVFEIRVVEIKSRKVGDVIWPARPMLEEPSLVNLVCSVPKLRIARRFYEALTRGLSLGFRVNALLSHFRRHSYLDNTPTPHPGSSRARFICNLGFSVCGEVYRGEAWLGMERWATSVRKVGSGAQRHRTSVFSLRACLNQDQEC
jgi:hypothetical protein